MGLSQLITLVLITVSESARHLGCYKENSAAARLLSGFQQNFQGTLTPEICISLCKEKGFLYAGLQFRIECFCSKERPSFIHAADLSECNMKCEGDESKMCGDTYRINVYDIANKPANYVQANYVGCVADDGGRRALGGKFSPDINIMTPEFCVGYCFIKGYRYAGAQFKFQCFCGDEPVGSKRNEGECDMQCAGDSRFICGGEYRNSVYHTSIPDESEDGRLLGCYIDSPVRLLSGFVLGFQETNSPRKCMNACKALGYKYAGVQHGPECHCGNRMPEKEKETNENECLEPCPNGERKCGGVWRMLIYKTFSDPQTDLTVPNIVLATSQQPGAIGTGGTQSSTAPPTQETPPRKSSDTQTCVRSQSQVQGKVVCQGDRLFHDSFLSNNLKNNLWNHEVFMPSTPDYEFVVFDKSQETAYTSNGRLHLKVTPYTDEFIRSGKLELNRCTGRIYTEECIREAKAFSILPPIKAARITTKNYFTFKYGKVQVRAKLPLGDWIIPEIWLEPKRKVYGPSYTSGRIQIALARGNKDLKHNNKLIGNSLLESGVIMGTAGKIEKRTIAREKPEGWYRHFHNYTLIWEPDNISFLVDDKETEYIIPPEGGQLADLLGFDYSESIIWQAGSSIAPFDQEFYVSLGISVGGMKDFPDGCISNGHKKPWRNEAVKGMVNFWQDRDHWLPSWKGPTTEFQIEHITIHAL